MFELVAFLAGVAVGYAVRVFHVKRTAGGERAATAKGTTKPPGGGGGPGEGGGNP